MMRRCLILLCCLLTGCSAQKTETQLAQTDQNASHYLGNQPNQWLITPSTQSEHQADYLAHYFRPWQEATLTPNEIKHSVNHIYTAFLNHPGMGKNHQAITYAQLYAIRRNANIQHLNAHTQPAITLHATACRRLPTHSPSFQNLDKAGQGYPFDRLQETLIPANVPIRIYHTSRNHQWAYIGSHNTKGWVQVTDIATVDEHFIQQWQSLKQWLTPTVRSVPLQDQQGHFLHTARLGSVYPVSKADQRALTILVADQNSDHQAVIKQVPVTNTAFEAWPLPPTRATIAQLINQLIDEPYDWGGQYGYRDCSATTEDLFAAIGFWLPRNANDQAAQYPSVQLAGLSQRKKNQLIHQQAIPFFTLIHLRGHVMLYLGEQHRQPFVFHNAWGLTNWRDGRIHIGHAMISPLNLGEHDWRVRESLLQRTTSLSIIR